MPSSHLLLGRPLLLLPPIPPSIRVLTPPKDVLFIIMDWNAKVGSQETDSDAGRDWGQEEKGTTEDEMTGWHH